MGYGTLSSPSGENTHSTQSSLTARALMEAQESLLSPKASNNFQNISPEDIRAAGIEARINAMATGALNKPE